LERRQQTVRDLTSSTEEEDAFQVSPYTQTMHTYTEPCTMLMSLSCFLSVRFALGGGGGGAGVGAAGCGA
jgi:hypothetical protein